ncbi:MAG: adenylate/guanylate cyclase domain-containing protein, partial [Paracoccaceae bacterium]
RNVAGESEIRFGLGLHVGNVMLGNVGLKQRLTFSAFGSAVNEVQRLESLTKKYGVPIVASEDFTDYCSGTWDFKAHEALKGIRDEVAIYLPSAALLQIPRHVDAARDADVARSDAEQVMMLFRDMKTRASQPFLAPIT